LGQLVSRRRQVVQLFTHRGFQGLGVSALDRLVLLLAVSVVAVGCAGIEPPRLRHPGTAQSQQRRAEQFDPYPLPDLGPETEARPRGFLLPAPQNERVQNAETFTDRYGQPPPPGLYRPQRPLPRQAVPFDPGPLPQAPTVFVP
jgi:hypothetical protein